MTNTELIATIRAEIERLMDEYNPIVGGVDELTGAHIVLAKLLSFLDTLESEKPMNPEAAMKELDEKIALVKQRGTWDGVDVDKYMDEVRGREPEKLVPNDLKEAVKNYIYKAADSPGDDWTTDDIRRTLFNETIMTNEELIQAIRNEIERRKNNAETLRERNICIDILSFLDTLESEKPTQEELKREIEAQLSIFPYTKVSPELPESRWIVIRKELYMFARHFAKWGAEHAKQ